MRCERDQRQRLQGIGKYIFQAILALVWLVAKKRGALNMDPDPVNNPTLITFSWNGMQY